ncbi:hypothetical protein [Streptomyces sp. NPDC015125]|uniref:hypothetical protein n=1 Tax=Streptomyces sp. NPDC015125 TaxID=3364938 RepID=UPI003700D0EE
MAATIGFRPTEEDTRIIKDAMRGGEGTSDVIRRALRLLEREEWLSHARSDAERLARGRTGRDRHEASGRSGSPGHTSFIHGDPIHYLGRDELAEVEHAVTRYLGL